MSFRLRGDEDSPAFRFVYPGVLRDLELEDEAVEKYIAENREQVESAARGKSGPPDPGDEEGRGAEVTATIAAIATGPAPGGIGIIRISGPLALEAARAVAPDLPSEVEPRRAYFTRL